jgi:hypothetical protein
VGIDFEAMLAAGTGQMKWSTWGQIVAIAFLVCCPAIAFERRSVRSFGTAVASLGKARLRSARPHAQGNVFDEDR